LFRANIHTQGIIAQVILKKENTILITHPHTVIIIIRESVDRVVSLVPLALLVLTVVNE